MIISFMKLLFLYTNCLNTSRIAYNIYIVKIIIIKTCNIYLNLKKPLCKCSMRKGFVYKLYCIHNINYISLIFVVLVFLILV